MPTKLGLAQRLEAKDGPRNITFVGWQLGEADSRPGSEMPPRWTELRLFKTESGQYLLEKVGCSDVFHNESCPTEPGKPRRGRRRDNLWEAIPAEAETDDPSDIFVPCATCNPAFDDEPVWVEKDIYSTSMLATADEVITALERPDTRNTANRYLSRVARSLLDQAVEKDDGLREALSRPVEIP